LNTSPTKTNSHNRKRENSGDRKTDKDVHRPFVTDIQALRQRTLQHMQHGAVTSG
jgi:hypothetical protein